MAYFVKLDKDNFVLTVVPVADNNATTETDGISYLSKVHGYTNWKQCSYNTRGGIHYNPNSNEPSIDQSKALRANFPSIGWKYDPINNIFHEEKPFESWILNTTTGLWESPIAMPTIIQQIIDESNGIAHYPMWNESNLRWESNAQGNYYWNGSNWISF
jgi:hypothetical protein